MASCKTIPYWCNGSSRYAGIIQNRYESRNKLFEGYIAHLVTLFDKLFQMIIHDAVFPIAALAFDFTHLLGVILVMLAEHGEQCLVFHAHSQKGVTHFLCRYIIVMVANFLIGFVDAYTDFV